MASKVTGESSQGSVGETLDGALHPAPDDIDPSRAVAPPPAGDYPVFVEVEREHYVIGDVIAKGGMGRVFEARDRRLGRPVAIKELLPKNRVAARRFEREARITARLQHPSIIHVHEAGVWSGGEPFYAMQKVSGRSLDKVVAERATLEERLGLLPNVIAVVDALAYAHHQNVIHRDLKPSNVLVGEYGETVVIDWGLAKDLGAPADPTMSLQMPASAPEETLSGSVVGTPAYMPPEQARGEPLDQRADVYALGALLYHVLVGKAPYTDGSSKQVLAAVLAGPPVPVAECEPGTPADLTTIIAKSMARDPADRYASAGELAADLKRFQTGQLVAAHHYSRVQLAWRWLRRNRVVVAISVVAIGALAVLGWFSLGKIIDAKDDAIAARRTDALRRRSLLEERGRAELLAGRAGPALVNLLAAAGEDTPDGALGFLIADAARPFQAEIRTVEVGTGPAHVAFSPRGSNAAIASEDGRFGVWAVEALVPPTAGAYLRVAWSPDGRMLAVAERSGRIRLLRFSGPIFDDAVLGDAGTVTDLSFSDDGDSLVTASTDGVARLWTVGPAAPIPPATPAPPQSFHLASERTGTLTAARVSPGGAWLAIADSEGFASVFALPAGTQKTEFRGHTNEIRSLRWSPDGTRALTVSRDGTAQIWDPATGKQVVAPLVHDGMAELECAIWSHDGTRVLTGGADRAARIWQLPDEPDAGGARPTAKLIAVLPHTDTVTALAFSGDDRWIATGGRVARIWDADGQPLAAFEHEAPVTSLDFDARATMLLTGTTTGRARWWNLSGLGGQRVDLESPVHALAMSSSGMIAAGTDDSRITIWGAGTQRRVLREHLGRVFAAAFSPDGSRLVTAGEDQVARLWTVAKDGPSRELPTGLSPVHAVAFAPGGRALALGDDAGTVALWDLETATSKKLAIPSGGPPTRIVALAYAPDGRAIVIATADGWLHVVTTSGELVSRARTGVSLAALTFSRDGRRLVVGGNGEVQLWKIDGFTLAPELTLEGPTGAVRTVAVTSDGTRVVTGGDDGVARIWDAGKGKLLGTRDPHGGPIGALAVGPDDAVLWTGSADGTARLWDIHAVRDTREVQILAATKVPWALGAEDDIVRRTDTRRN